MACSLLTQAALSRRPIAAISLARGLRSIACQRHNRRQKRVSRSWSFFMKQNKYETLKDCFYNY